MIDSNIVGPAYCDNDTGICQPVSAAAVTPPSGFGGLAGVVQTIALIVLFFVLILIVPFLQLMQRKRR